MSDPTLTLLCKVHGLNKDWLLTGTGSMFTAPLAEIAASPGLDPLLAPLEDLIRDAREVLTSDNAMAAEALAKNIKYFAHAVQQERRLARVEDEQDAARSRQAATDAKLAALMEEFIRLKERYNLDCDLNAPATAPDPEATSPASFRLRKAEADGSIPFISTKKIRRLRNFMAAQRQKMDNLVVHFFLVVVWSGR